MTSQKSFKNNFGFAYRTGLKSNIAVALIQFFIGALAFVYVPAKALFKKVAADSASGKIESYNVKNDECLLQSRHKADTSFYSQVSFRTYAYGGCDFFADIGRCNNEYRKARNVI